MKWITRERPKIDRIACPWLIKRFIDSSAEIIFVPADQVLTKAAALGATPFDVPDTEFSHYGSECTFDYFLKKYKLNDSALHTLAPIIRGADTDNHSLAEQAAGLWAISAGLAFNTKDDYKLLEKGMMIYDALYSWAKHLQHEKHLQQPNENLLLQVFNKYIQPPGRKKKLPSWKSELETIIQDHVDTNLTLSLKAVADELQVNPTYLSREFAKYFDNLSFGEYIRKLRIEKAIQLLETSKNSMAEIAYLTGFSDQSHFTRIFRKFTGLSPSEYRKNAGKGKGQTNR
ncbi:chromate resistance protein ChrB domain-containing protein [Spirosoma soli]|uniref:Chromate resistance protein ChrB domain-containing protein n=2 Tax=Spirosoma soli TaxID=1770529 RepID=A0ABW5M502_9BACT